MSNDYKRDDRKDYKRKDNNSDSSNKYKRDNNPNKDYRKTTVNAGPQKFIYGINSAFEVIRSGKRKIERAMLSASATKNPRLQKLVSVLEKNDISFKWEEKGRLIDVCSSHDHQGVVLICSEFEYASIDDVLSHDRVILLNNVEDPQNVGAVLRSAEVFGFKGILLPEKGTPEIYASIVKVSAGATEFLDIYRHGGVTSYLTLAKEEGFTIVSLDARGDKSFEDILTEAPEKLLLVLGGENKGVGQFVLNSSDHIIGIEQKGKINSLNASVAAGIAMAFLK